MSGSRLIVYKTLLANIDVIVTNEVGAHVMQGQYFVFDIDNDARQVIDSYGSFPTFEQADDRALQSVKEYNIIASATIPDDLGF